MEDADAHPKVASVGLKEEEAKRKSYKILIGRDFYTDTGQGFAMGNPKGFVKAIVEHETWKFLEDTFESLREA